MTRRGYFILAAFLISGALWSALFLSGCLALTFASRIVEGLL
jgi:hypothetical protein